jgi:hypothetical protein
VFSRLSSIEGGQSELIGHTVYGTLRIRRGPSLGLSVLLSCCECPETSRELRLGRRSHGRIKKGDSPNRLAKSVLH